MKSIRTYLLTRLVGGTALVLGLACTGVYVAFVRSLEHQFDRNLVDRVQALGAILFQHGELVDFAFSGELMPEYEPGEAPAYFELRFVDGELLERSESLGDAALSASGPAAPEPRLWTAPLPDGRRGRWIVQLVEIHHLFPEEGPGRPVPKRVEIVVARGLEELTSAARSALAWSVGLGLGLLAVVAALAWLSVERGLEPARRLARVLGGLRVNDLPERIEVGELPAELAPVAATTEALVGRVQRALEQERRTTADIAHELRTPVSELLTVSEVALRGGRDPDDDRAALGTVRDVAWRMGRSVSTLLKLARLDVGAESFECAPVDLAELLGEVARPLAAVLRERALTLEQGRLATARVLGDAAVLRIVVSNLLGNAAHHAPRGTRISVGAERDGEHLRFHVENDAPDLDGDDLRSLAEPFWRGDRSRTDRDRSGLGLALSRALVDRCGDALDFRLDRGRFRATLTLRADPGATNGR